MNLTLIVMIENVSVTDDYPNYTTAELRVGPSNETFTQGRQAEDLSALFDMPH